MIKINKYILSASLALSTNPISWRSDGECIHVAVPDGASVGFHLGSGGGRHGPVDIESLLGRENDLLKLHKSLRWTPFLFPHREVQPQPADVWTTLADGVGAWVWIGGGDAALDQVCAVLRAHGATRKRNYE